MVERMRRLRMSLASSSPGASGDIARPNYVGPSGNGLVERMKAGESPWNQGRSNGRPCPFPEGGPEDEGKRRSGAPRGERPTSLGVRRKASRHYPAPFGAPLPHVGEGRCPLAASEGKECRRTPRLARTGAAELWLLLAGCLTCESDARARQVRAWSGCRETRSGSGLLAAAHELLARLAVQTFAVGLFRASQRFLRAW